MLRPGSIRSYQSAFSLVQRIADAGCVAGTLALLVWFYDVLWLWEYTVAALAAGLLFLILAEINSLYGSWRGASSWTESVRVGYTWFWVLLGLLLLAYATKTSEIFSRRVVLSWFLVAPFSVIGWRLSVRRILRAARKGGRNSRQVAIAGAGQLGQWLARTMNDNPDMGLRVVGFYDDASKVGESLDTGSAVVVRGALEALVSDAKSGQLDAVYVAISMRHERRIQDLLDGLADTAVPVYVVPDLFVFNLLHARWSDIGGQPVISIFDTPFTGLGGLVKRIEDVCLSLVIVVLMAIPMLLVAAVVKLSSAGPVIFKQRRYGIGGDEISVWKFRTMTVCEDGDDVPQARRLDPRVTGIGAFLRKTSLDELPQFFNVLQGRMSIVGPRPHAVAHNEQYRKLIPNYMLRHLVKPGITGWAQVNGWRGETDTLDKMQKRVEFDLEYIRNWSLLFDLKIILLTILRGFRQANGY